MARGFFRFLSAFTVQASAAITADTDSGGSQIEFNTLASQNLDGCERAEIEIDVTSAPATATICKIYVEPIQHDGVGNGAAKLVGSINIGTSVDKYTTEINVMGEKGKILLHAVDYTFTASASMKGKYPSDT